MRMAPENIGNEDVALFVLKPILDTSGVEGKFAETIKRLGKKSLTIDITGDTSGLSKSVEEAVKKAARWEGMLQDSYAKIAENTSLINRLRAIPEGQRTPEDISKLNSLTADSRNLAKLNAAIEDIFKQMGLNIQTPERKKYNEEILPAYVKAKTAFEQGTISEADFKLAEKARDVGLQAAQEVSNEILRAFREALSESFKSGKIDLSTLLVPKVAKTRTQEILDDTLYGGWDSNLGFYKKAIMLRNHLGNVKESSNLSEEDRVTIDDALIELTDYIDKYEGIAPEKRASSKTLKDLRAGYKDPKEGFAKRLYAIGDDTKTSEGKQDWESHAEEILLEIARGKLSNAPGAKGFVSAIKNLRKAQGVVEKLKYKEQGFSEMSPEEQTAFREEQQAAQQALADAQTQVQKTLAGASGVVQRRNRKGLKEEAEYKQTAKDFVEAAKDDDGQTEETQQAVQQEAKQAREEAAQHVEEAAKEGAQEARQKILDALLDSNGEVKQPDGTTKEGREAFAEIQKVLDENRDALSSDEQALIDKYKQEAENAIKPTRGRGAGVKNATARTATQKNIADLAKLAKEKQATAQTGTTAPVTAPAAQTTQADQAAQAEQTAQITQATQAAEQKAEANEHVAQSAEQATEAEKKMQEAVGNTAPVEQATAAAEQNAEANERAADAANAQADAAKKSGSGSGNGGGGSGGGGNPPSNDGGDVNPADDLNRMMDNAKANVLKAVAKANTLLGSLSETSGADSNLDGIVAELQHKVADAEARIERSDFDGDALSEDTLAAIMSDYDQLAELVERVQVRSKEISDGIKRVNESEAIYDREIAKDAKQTAKYNTQRTGLANNLRGGLDTLQGNLGKLDKFGVDTEAIRSQVQGALSSNQAMSLMDDTTEATKEKVEALAAAWEVVNKAVQETTASIKQQETAAAAVDKAQTDIHAQIEKASTNVSNLQGVNTSAATSAANSYLAEISQAQRMLEEISAWDATPETRLQALNTVLESITDTAKNAGEAFKHYKKQAADAAKADDKLTKATTTAQKSLATIQDMRTQWTAMTASQRTELDAIETNLNEGLAGNDLEKLNAANQALVVFRANVKAAGKDTRSFFDASKAITSKLSSFFSMGQLVSTVVNRLKQAVTEVKKIDSSMVNLRKVAPGTDSSFMAYKKGAAARAIELSTSMTDYIDATTGFARMGESLGDAQKLGELAVIYKNVGDEISSVDDATNSLISTMKAFNKTTAEAESIVDVANYVGKGIAHQQLYRLKARDGLDRGKAGFPATVTTAMVLLVTTAPKLLPLKAVIYSLNSRDNLK